MCVASFNQDSFMCVIWLNHKCGITRLCSWHYSCVWSDSIRSVVSLVVCVTWFIRVCNTTYSYVWHHSLRHCFIHLCGMVQSDVWHGLCICATWLVRIWCGSNSDQKNAAFTCAAKQIQVVNDTFICATTTKKVIDQFTCATWRIHTRGMTHSYVWHDAFICVAWLVHMCDRIQVLWVWSEVPRTRNSHVFFGK